MRQRIRVIAPVLLLAALAGGGWWWWGQRASAAATSGQLSGSGTIEAEEVVITAEVGGRAQELLVTEGQKVVAGQLLARIDTALIEAQREQGRAAVAVAEANLALLRGGSREQELALAQAQLDQAIAQRDGAERAWQNALASTVVTQAQTLADGAERVYADALKSLKNPQDLRAQVAQARANRDAAQRALERLRAASRPEDLAAAQAQLNQARANLETQRNQLSAAKTRAELELQKAVATLTQAQSRYATAKETWEFVEQHGEDPMLRTPSGAQLTLNDAQRQQYYDAYVQSEAGMHAAEAGVAQAQVAYDNARQNEITGIQAAESQVQLAEAALAKVRSGPTAEDVAAAETALASAQRVLDVVSATLADPQHLQAAADTALAQLNNARAGIQAAEVQRQIAVDAAAAQLASADTQVRQAHARLELAQAGAQAEQIQAAEAQLAQTRAALRQLDVQIAKATLSAPRTGIVLSRPIHEGEQANPGATLMTIGSLDTVRLTLYIGETDIGRVRPGQAVEVSVDSFPGRVFQGQVSFIAQEAQFTPRNVQTREERATTVFAVRVELANPDHALKPGMPADAVIVE